MKKTKLPHGWQEIEFGNKEYFEIQPSGIDKFEGEKDYLSTESIQGTDIEKIECKITHKDRPSRANMQPVLNSVWFAKMQATLKVYSFTQANKGEINGFILSTGFAGIRVEDSKVDPFYLRHFLKSKEFNKIKDSNCSGATQKAIGNEKLSKIKIPLPSLSVQKKIVKLLDRAEQAKIKRGKADKLTKDFIDSNFDKLFGDLGKNDKKYPIKTLGELTEEFRYGTSNKSGLNGYFTLGIPNIVAEKINLSRINKVEVTQKEFSKLKLKYGDVLFVRTNGNPNYIGRCNIFNLKADDFIFASYLIRCRLKKDIEPLFLKSFLEAKCGRIILRTKCKTTAGQYNINTEGLGSIPVPLPPLPLQQKFAKIVEQVEKLKEKQQKSKDKIEEIFNSLMQKAFRGELVR